MKTASVVKIICWSLVAVILTGILVFGLCGGFRGGVSFAYAFEDDKGYATGGASLPVDGISSLEIDWVSGDVLVAPYDGEEIVFSETASHVLKESHKLRYKVEDGKLKIKFRSGGWHIGSFPGKQLTVQLPRTLAAQMHEVELESTSAPVRISGIQAQTVHAEVVSGNLHLSDVTTQQLSMESVSGKTEFDGKVTGSIDCETVSGSVVIRSAACPQRVDTESVSGGVELSIPDSDGFSVSFSKVSGDLSSEWPVTLNDGKGSYKTGSASFRFDTVSGDVRVTQYR